MRRFALLSALLCGACAGSGGGAHRLLVGATHTVEDSGLLDTLLAAYHAADPGEDVQVVVAGSGEILQYGRRRDLDVLLTHAPADEQAFMAEGHGEDRRPVMWNEFILLAPPADPAGITGTNDVITAFRKLAEAGAGFVSRGDLSGTHQRELELWDSAGVRPSADVYMEAGAGMAAALRVASARRAYVLSDLATYSVLRAELDLDVASRGDPRLVNRYSVIRVAGARNPDAARRFVDWLTGAEAQALIGGFGTVEGDVQRFHPDTPDPSPR